MPILGMNDLGGYQCFTMEECRDAGRLLTEEYRTAAPFPHVVMDDFLDPELLRGILAEFPDTAGHDCFRREQERLKYQFRPDQCAGPLTRILFSELNSSAFLAFLSELTGIDGLIADPYFSGAGLHETKLGGHLSIHADFPHHREMRLNRRINLLIYLNEDWNATYGGALELWDSRMRRLERSVLPTFGRAVIFGTGVDTFHGHPDPLTCPPTRSRRSIATYYYTAPPTAGVAIEETTNFRIRPGSNDKRDWHMLRNMAANWLPPVISRRLGLG